MAWCCPTCSAPATAKASFATQAVERWIDDLAAASRHAEARGRPVRAVLAVRLGCALAVAAARAGAVPAVSASVWWQPVLDGKRHLAQFLRLRVAAGSMRGDDPETVDGLRNRSAAGETLAVAGYELSPALVRGLEALATDALPPQAGALHWIEFVRDEQAAPPLPATRFVERARAGGASASAYDGGGRAVLGLDRDRPACRRRSSRPRPSWRRSPLASRESAVRGIGVGPMNPVNEKALVFDCGADRLVGILHAPASDPRPLGVLIVVGGPQYRAGSHRQFVLMARALAAAGYPVLRFDHRGIGDSDGAPRTFENLDDDVRAGLDALHAEVPALRGCVIFGLCDAASAALMYCRRDPPRSSA